MQPPLFNDGDLLFNELSGIQFFFGHDPLMTRTVSISYNHDIHMQIRYLPTLLFLILFLLSILPVTAGADSSGEVAARLQKKYDSLTSLSFSFKQKSQGELAGRAKTGSGQAFFYKDNAVSKMRWNYNEPDQQVLISDGETFKMYFSELQQMIVTPAESLENDLTYSIFSGRQDLVETFHIFPSDLDDGIKDEANPISVIKLVPVKEHSQVQHIHVWVDSDSLIRRIEMQDHFGTITLLNFSDIKKNFLDSSETDPTALFMFTPPEGTEIIQQ